MGKITVKELEALPRKAAAQGKAVAVSDGGRHGAGGLRVRATPAGKILFYFRHLTSEGKRDDYPLGAYAADGQRGLTLEQARDRVAELTKLYQSGVKDIRLHLEAEERAQAAALRAQAEEQERQEAGSLGKLLEAYTDYLRERGKPSLKDVQNIIHLHIVKPFPDLAETRASEITPDDLCVIFDRMADKGLKRTLGKTRAILHSAFNLAAKAKYERTIPSSFRAFKVPTNPAASLPTYRDQSTPGDRILSIAELRHLLEALHQNESMAARALLVGLYLGGQRPTQLVRVTVQDVDLERGEIVLRDGKGRRQHPRLHLLPLVPVKDWITPLLESNANAPSLFSSDGVTIPHVTTLSKLVREIAEGKYRLGDIRRTCESELARIGVDKNIRAQLLSHGLGGVQAQHYDKYDYWNEKQDVLDTWGGFLDGVMAGKVAPLRRATA